MNCCIIGIGQFGYEAALQLIENGNQVYAVDKDINIINQIQDRVSYAVCIEIKDEKSLSLIGIDTFDTIILAMGENFEQLVIIAGLLKKNFDVPLIICRANNDQQKTILHMIGIEYIILPEKESALQLVDRISIGFGYFYRIAQNYSLTYMHCKKNWIGSTIEELQDKFSKTSILGKKNQSDIQLIDKNYVLTGNEIIVISGYNKDLQSINGI